VGIGFAGTLTDSAGPHETKEAAHRMVGQRWLLIRTARLFIQQETANEK
jgi:hypothetical protein